MTIKGFNSSNGNDLPSEHGISHRRPNSRHALSNTYATPAAKKLKYYPLPPLAARTYSFFVQSNVQDSRVAGYDIKRRGLALQNLSPNDIYVSFGSPPSDDGLGSYTNALLIPANGFYECPANAATVSDVYAVSATVGSHLLIIESTITSGSI